jgi:hypothetical protein
MRSQSERVSAIEKRTAELKREQKKKRDFAVTGLCAAACLILIIAAALVMPGLMTCGGPTSDYTGAAASVFARSGAVGYVLIGLLAFVLGCCVTILCFRLRRNDRERNNGRNNR